MMLSKIIIYIVCYFGLFVSVLFLLTFFENKKYLKNPKPKKIYKVSIIVPAYNEEKNIEKTLKSLIALDYPEEKLEIMVVDDGSIDNTLKIAKRFEKYGVKVFHKENTGKSDSLNFALKKCSGELVGALDADSFVQPSTLKKMIGHFNDEKVMSVTPSLKIWAPKGILSRIQMGEFLMGVYLRKVFAYLHSIHVTPGPFTLYRKWFFDTYGPYDTNTLTEDIEIALRIQSHNYIIENAIDANVYTSAVKKFRPLQKQRLRWYKGFLDNCIRYKHLFSKDHGNLGLFILPAAFVFTALAIFFTGWSIFNHSDTLSKNIKNLVAANFDFTNFLDIKLDLFFFDMSGTVILSLILLALGIIVISLTKKYSKEKQKVGLSYLTFILFYWVVFSYWWVLATLYKVSGRKIRWGKKSL